MSSKSVLFVCMGNICRSPAGEGVLQHLVQRQSLEHRIAVDSAGTHGYHVGEKADSRMRQEARNRGYELNSRSRRVTRIDLEEFDLVIAMDRENFLDLDRLHEHRKADLKLLSEFLPHGWPEDVPDPYYGGGSGFETVMDMIEEACPRIISELLAGTD